MLSDIMGTSVLIWFLSAALVVVGVVYCMIKDKDDNNLR